MQKITLIVLILFLATETYARIGIADWMGKTPGGNEINNFSDMTLYLKNGEELKWVAEWYFYEDYIIGRLGNKYKYGDTIGYFIVNESTLKIDTFQSESSWKNYILKNNLKPKFWARWFHKDWTIINGRLSYLFIYGFYISIPVLILFWVILYRAFKREGFNKRKPYTIFVLIILGLIALRYLLDSFPQSW